MHGTSSILFAYHLFSCGKQLVLRWQSQGFGTLCCLRVTRLFVYIMRSYVVEYSSYMSHVMVGVPKLVQIALLLNCFERCLVSTVMDWCLSMWLGCFLCRRFQPGQVSCSNRKKFQPARKRLQWSVQWSNGWSNGPMVGQMVSPMVQWSVQSSNGRFNGPMVCPMVCPMVQWSGQMVEWSVQWSNGRLDGPMFQ